MRGDSIIPDKYVHIVALPFGSPYKRTHTNYQYIVEGEFEKAFEYALEEPVKLSENTFFQTNRSYLVNLRSVRGLDENYVLVGMDRIPLSKGKRGDFIEAFNGFIKS